MKTLKKWMATPLSRLGLSFLLMAGGAFASTLFVPFAAFSFLGVLLLLMLGQQEKLEWIEGKQIHCPICNRQTRSWLVIRKNYMYPLLPFIGRSMSIPLEDDYYLVCQDCLETHVGKQELTSIMIIGSGGLAHAKRISQEEYCQLTQQN